MFDCSKFLQAEVASIWFLEHIVDFSNNYCVPVNLIHLGRTLCHPINNLIHCSHSHWYWTLCRNLYWAKQKLLWMACIPSNMFPGWLHFASGATEVFFYQGIMPKVPEDINNKSWGYWSLNNDFLAPPPTFEEPEYTENFSAPSLRWAKSPCNGVSSLECNFSRISPSFETISLSVIEDEFLRRVTLQLEGLPGP